jgi:hypothetical protein
MMSSSELSSNEERIADCLLANLHIIFYGGSVPVEDQERVARRTLDIAFGQCDRGALTDVLKSNTHAGLRDKVLALL